MRNAPPNTPMPTSSRARSAWWRRSRSSSRREPIELARRATCSCLASDGLSDLVSDDELLKLVHEKHRARTGSCAARSWSRSPTPAAATTTSRCSSCASSKRRPTRLSFDLGRHRSRHHQTRQDAGRPDRAAGPPGPPVHFPDHKPHCRTTSIPPAPTLFDDSPYPPRTTAPDLGPRFGVVGEQRARAGISTERKRGPCASSSGRGSGRVLFWIAVAVVLAIVSGVALWWALLAS